MAKKTDDPVTITGLLIENTRRIHLASYKFEETGLILIAGDNEQGKTTHLDAIAWALGGERLCPKVPPTSDGKDKSKITVRLSNGLIATRSWVGENGYLTVKSEDGMTGGQATLKAFLNEFALNLAPFLHSSDTDRFAFIRKVIKLDTSAIETEVKLLEAARAKQSGVLERQQGIVDGLKQVQIPDDTPDELVDVQTLLDRLSEAATHNAQEQVFYDRVDAASQRKIQADAACKQAIIALKAAEKQKKDAEAACCDANAALAKAEEERAAFKLVDVDDLQAQLNEAETINNAVRAKQKLNPEKCLLAAEQKAYDDLSGKIDAARAKIKSAHDNAEWPVPGMGLKNGIVTYKDRVWEHLSGRERLFLAVAAARKANPKCGFVLIDGLEAFDLKTRKEFCGWLQKEKLQAIATVVGEAKDSSITIVEGEDIQGLLPPMEPVPGRTRKDKARDEEVPDKEDDDDIAGGDFADRMEGEDGGDYPEE